MCGIKKPTEGPSKKIATNVKMLKSNRKTQRRTDGMIFFPEKSGSGKNRHPIRTIIRREDPERSMEVGKVLPGKFPMFPKLHRSMGRK
jgi:hypothetical protein